MPCEDLLNHNYYRYYRLGSAPEEEPELFESLVGYRTGPGSKTLAKVNPGSGSKINSFGSTKLL
jgi:hypothetical protein